MECILFTELCYHSPTLIKLPFSIQVYFPDLRLLVWFCNLFSLTSVLGLGLSTGFWYSHQWVYNWKKSLSPSNLLLRHSSLVRDKALWTPPPPMPGYWRAHSSVIERLLLQWLYIAQKKAFWSPFCLSSGSYSLLSSPQQCSLLLTWDVIDVLPRVEHSIVTYSLCCPQACIHWHSLGREDSLSLSIANVYRYEHIYI